MINPHDPAVFLQKALRPDRRGRLRRRCRARLEWLEDRTLLAGTAPHVLAGIAIPIALGMPTTGTLAAGDTVFYQVTPTTEGKLVAQVDSGGVAMRLTLLNGQDQVLMQSDGQSPTNPDDLITADVPAGPEYLEVENLGGPNTYTLTTSLTPSNSPFEPISLGTLYDPDAIVAGDFTGDGRTDLAVANGGDGTVSVLLGNGDGTFQNQVTYNVGIAPEAIVAGDFTGDGRTDLAVVNNSDNTVSVLLGNGDGTFQNQVTYAVGSNPGAIVAGDFTGDGRTDLAVVNNGDNTVSVLLGNGDGTFQNQVTYTVGIDPDAIVAGDFTGDGHTDLAVANEVGDTVSVLLGNGDGTFQHQVTYAVGNGPGAIVAGDFTGDGRTDLAVANSGTVSVLLGNGDGTFQNQVTYAVGSGPDAIVAGDFTGDGRTDLAVVNGDTVSVLLGNGDGTFQHQVTDNVGNGPGAIVAGDFTGDGRTDLAVVNGLGDTVSVLLGNGDGTFQNQVTDSVGIAPDAIVAGDFTGDGRTDLAVANRGGTVSVLLGNGDGTFQNQGTYAVGSNPGAIVAGDFTGDGRTDLAVVNYGDNTVSVLLGNGDGTFQNQVTYTVGSNPGAIVAGDFTGDGRTDLAVVNDGDFFGGTVSVLLGNGDGTFQHQVTYAVGIGPGAILAGDFTGDGRTDLAVANRGGTVSVLLGNGDGTFQPQVTYAAGLFPDAIVAGDFTGDGRTDLAVANSGDNTVSVLLGNGDGTFQNQVTYAVGTFPDAIVAGDFTGDGRTDLAVVNDGDFFGNTVSVLLGNGDGTFQNQVTYAVGDDPRAIVAGDFTGDGRTDLAVVNDDDNTVSVLLGNGNGTFQSQVTYAVGSASFAFSIVAIVAGDFTGDGRTDLAVANEGGTVTVLLGNGDDTLSPPGPSVTTPDATPILADLTGDGVSDAFVVDGAGDILWRRGQPEAPGTFDPPITINAADPSRDIVGHPSRDIVAVETNQGPVLASVDATDNAVSLYAWRDGSFAVIGSLPTGNLPAQIVAGDLYGDGGDDLVVRNAGDGTLSIFINTDNESGPFTTLPSPFDPPITIPVGPGISDVTLSDVSGDGRMDILVTDKLTGLVGVISSLGPVVLAPPVMYPAGTGLYAVTNSSGYATVTTLEATVGVAAAPLTKGGPDDLVAIDPGSNTASVLSGLGGGRFANPVTVPTVNPAIQVLVVDLLGNRIPDMIVLSSPSNQGVVAVYRGNGQGGFLPDPFTIPVGPQPTGMTLADVTGNGKLDLLVGNAYGDLLVLLGNGDGTFQPYHNANQNVALAVLPNGSKTPDFIFADQGLDRVVVDYSGAKSKTLVDQTGGLLAPGAVVLADLNGDGIPDLIVADSGGNNVLVYPGLGNGQFGPELNGGNGIFVGTNPVSITVANLTGRPDLVVTDEGSNEVSILLNEPTANGGFALVAGPRFQAGPGPTSAVVTNVPGNAYPDLLVTDGGTDQVRVLPGVGNGFFVDSGPQVKTFNLPPGSDPVQVMVGSFLPHQGPEIATVNRGANDITVISDFTTATPVFSTFATGGIEPVEAIAVTFTGAADESLVVANGGDGLFTLLGGADGLEEEESLSEPYLPAPTALDLASVSSNEVSFYAATAGMEAAFTLAFILPGFTPSTGPIPGSSSASPNTPAMLVPLTPGALALVGTLLVTLLDNPANTTETVLRTSSSAALLNTAENAAAVNTSFLSVGPSQGQSGFSQGSTGGSNEGEDAELDAAAGPAPPINQAPAPRDWRRFVLGVDEAVEQIRKENQDALPGRDEPAAGGESPPDDGEEPLGCWVPGDPGRRPRAPSQESSLTGRLPDADRLCAKVVDEVIESFAIVPGNSWSCIEPPTLEMVSAVLQIERRSPDRRVAPAEAAWVSVAIASTLVIHASPLAEALRDRRVMAVPFDEM